MALAGKDRSIIPLIPSTDHVLHHCLQCLYPGQMTRNEFLYTEFSAELSIRSAYLGSKCRSLMMWLTDEPKADHQRMNPIPMLMPLMCSHA